MNFRPLLAVPPIVIAAAVFVWMNNREQEAVKPVETGGLAVRVSTVLPQTVRATATGYGRVQPVRDWTSVGEVQGRIVGMRDGLAVGSVVEKGEVLIEIDQTDYELARGKALSNIASVEAQIRQLAREEENSRESLEVAENIFEVTKAEYERVISLVERGASTQAALDNAQKALLTQTSSITSHKNTLALYPARRQTLEASLAIRKAELAEAERSISKTRIIAPFRGRVSAQNAEIGQFARVGDSLLTLNDISAVEITAEIQPRSFAPMLAVAFSDGAGSETVVDTTRAVEILNSIGVSAEVGLAVSGVTVTWPAEIVRLRGTMDSDTGSLGLVVRVDDPMISQRPLNRPPLNVGTFVEVNFATRPVDNLLTVPRTAVRYDADGSTFVYLTDAENRLVRQGISVGAVIRSDVQVVAGLEGGETLVLSDPQPPVLGMSLNPVFETESR